MALLIFFLNIIGHPSLPPPLPTRPTYRPHILQQPSPSPFPSGRERSRSTTFEQEESTVWEVSNVGLETTGTGGGDLMDGGSKSTLFSCLLIPSGTDGLSFCSFFLSDWRPHIGQFGIVATHLPSGTHQLSCRVMEETRDPGGGTNFRIISVAGI